MEGCNGTSSCLFLFQCLDENNCFSTVDRRQLTRCAWIGCLWEMGGQPTYNALAECAAEHCDSCLGETLGASDEYP